MLHRCICALTILLFFAVPSLDTAQAGVRQDFDKALAATGCTMMAAPAERLVWLAGWSGHSVSELARQAGFGAKIDNLGETDRFLPDNAAEAERMLDLMAAGAAGGLERFTADSKTYGARICPLLANGFLDQVLRDEKSAKAPFRPYLRFAQNLSLLHGCAITVVDGAFGPDTRASWNRMAAVLAPERAVSDAGIPLPGDILALAVMPVAQGACDADKGSTAHPLYDFAFSAHDGSMAIAPADKMLEEAGQFAPVRLRNRLAGMALENLDRSVGMRQDGTTVSEADLLRQFWSLVQKDFAGFVRDFVPLGGDSPMDTYLKVAQRALYGIDVAAMPEPAVALLEKLADKDRHARYALAGIYQFGAAGPADSDKAKQWLARNAGDLRYDFDAFAAYDAARMDAKQAAGFVRAMLEQDRKTRQAAGGEDAARTYRRIFISMGDIARFTRIARLIIRYPEVLDVVTAAMPEQRFVFGEMLVEGYGGEAQGRVVGTGLIASAAADGLPDAALRLAHLRRYQASPDRAEAARLYGIAAAAGSPEAAFALAEMQDVEGGDPAKIGALYDKAVELQAPDPMGWDLATALQNRIVEGSPFFAAKEGQAWLEQRVGQNYGLAQAVGDAFLCTSCGGIVDVAQAANWYRKADMIETPNDRSASTKLARLLIANPALEQTKDEALAILGRNAPASIPKGGEWYIGGLWYARSALLLIGETARRSGTKPEDVKRTVETFLGELCPKFAGCLPLTHDLATGVFDAALIGPGYAALRKLHDGALAQNGNYEAPAVALADTLASYGDFRGAIALLRSVGNGGDDVAHSLHMARRIVAAHLRRQDDELPDGLVDYVRLLSARGNAAAKALLDILSHPSPATPESAPTDVAAAQSAFDQQLARGALSRGLAVTARRLSEAKAATGDKDGALKLEFTALATEIKLADVDGMLDGALPTRLTRVCLLSRASERVSALGFDDAAITLAKYAVNELQAARRDIAQLPEELRTCFRDVAANHYRWLADLFIRHKRLDEARYVMGLLKDFETYEFVGRDQDYRKRVYDGFALDQLEQDFTAALGAIAPPATEKARWLAEARWKARNGKLSDADKAEMARVEKELAEAAQAFQQQLDAALAAARGLGRADRAAQLDNLKALQSFLRTEAGRKAAALHFVVLPQRLHVILTTAQFQTSATIDTLDGKPFEEAALNRKLDQFRALLQDPGSDPEPMARELYTLLLGPLTREIAGAGITTLLISPDRRLRYIPFATLHDEKGYLAQSYSIALLSDAGYEVAGDHRTGLEISALGMTQAAKDFQALPNVRSELSGIVEGSGASYGFLHGKIVLDKDFTKDALRDALQFGPPDSGALGVVHIASHFALGATDQTSDLLLGDGSLLSLADIKSDRFTYDFGSVDLLTLSACSTAYGLANSDGRDIESFSEVSRKGGARAILASLWPVNDLSTSLMMQRFYELRERRNLDKATALATVQREFIDGTLGQGDATESVVVETARRSAQSLEEATPVKVLDGFKHPFYWAPFIIMGNWQ